MNKHFYNVKKNQSKKKIICAFAMNKHFDQVLWQILLSMYSFNLSLAFGFSKNLFPCHTVS